jgi:hypothetical protein
VLPPLQWWWDALHTSACACTLRGWLVPFNPTVVVVLVTIVFHCSPAHLFRTSTPTPHSSASSTSSDASEPRYQYRAHARLTHLHRLVQGSSSPNLDPIVVGSRVPAALWLSVLQADVCWSEWDQAGTRCSRRCVGGCRVKSSVFDRILHSRGWYGIG